MLHEFLEWIEKQMREKGETWNADYMLSLIKRFEGHTQESAMGLLHIELAVLECNMSFEKHDNGTTTKHGMLWKKKLNVEQALAGGNGEIFFKDHDPREA